MDSTQESPAATGRINALIDRRPLDRVPVLSAADLYGAVMAGLSSREYYTDPQKAYQARVLVAKRHGFDDSPAYSFATWSDWAAWEFGGEIKLPLRETDIPVTVKRPVEKPGDVLKLKSPNPARSPVMGRRLACARINRRLGAKAVLQISPTTMAGSIVGLDNLLRWYIKEPLAVHLVLRTVTDYLLETADLYIREFGAENCAVTESFPLDSHALVSPQIFEKFGFVYIRELHEKLLAKGIKSWVDIHLCGDHTRNLPLWKEIPLAPRTIFSMGTEMDLVKTAVFFGEEHIVSGNLSSALLVVGSPEKIKEQCRTIIEKMKDAPGGFILRPACQLPPPSPEENVQALVDASREYGRY